MAGCRYCKQCKKETGNMVAEMEREENLRDREKKHGREFYVRGREIRELEGAQSVEREPQTEMVVSEICSSFVESRTTNSE